MIGNAERQRRWRNRHREQGFTTRTIIIPKSAVADLDWLARALRSAPEGSTVPRLYRDPKGILRRGR